MEFTTGLGLFLSLFQLWQHERDKGETAKKEDFFKWLLTHNFESIKESIENNTALVIQIENLLRLNQNELLNHFDVVNERLMRVLSGIDEFRELITRIAPQVALSKNEEYILKKLVESGENELILIKTNLRVTLQAGEQIIEGAAPRFVDSNLKHLAAAGYIQLQRESPPATYYLLTEAGEEYVLENKKKNRLSSQAEDILRQFYQSGDAELLTRSDGKGGIVIQTRNVQIAVSEPNYAQDDLDILEKRGLIKYDRELNFGGRRYLPTREGKEYVANMQDA